MLFVRAVCRSPLLHGLTVRLSLVSLDQPQSTRRQRCLKRGQVPFANIENVRLAADANSDCGGGMAGRPVEDPVSSAYVADGTCRASGRCRHDRKGSRHHLIRRLCRAHPLPAYFPADLPRCYSLVRSRRRR
jgi:hypothetical protein